MPSFIFSEKIIYFRLQSAAAVTSALRVMNNSNRTYVHTDLGIYAMHNYAPKNCSLV